MAARVGVFGDIPEQKCTKSLGYADSRFQLVEQVVAEGYDRWVRRLVAEICSLVQPRRPKHDLVGPACEA